jgi:hypothetical protein
MAHHTQGDLNRLPADFSSGQRLWEDIFKMLKGEKCQKTFSKMRAKEGSPRYKQNLSICCQWICFIRNTLVLAFYLALYFLSQHFAKTSNWGLIPKELSRLSSPHYHSST